MWIDVLRFVTPSGDPPYQLTLAVTKRALTPALQAAAVIALVEQLVVSGALDAGQANALTKKLENAIALLEIGDDARLHPDAVITWGPDGGTGHPDHRIVGNIATQLQRFGAPGVPERVFYMNLPVEGMRAMNPPRPEPPLVVPQAKFFTVRVPFAPEDLQATKRAAACHRSQFTAEVAERVGSAMARAWNGAIPLIPAFQTSPGTDLFR